MGMKLPIYHQKNVLNIWSEHNYILSHRLVHTTTCFGPVYWPLSGCIINLVISYTICACVGYSEGTRSRLTINTKGMTHLKHVVVCTNLCDNI
jgi:hypothetical protein